MTYSFSWTTLAAILVHFGSLLACGRHVVVNQPDLRRRLEEKSAVGRLEFFLTLQYLGEGDMRLTTLCLLAKGSWLAALVLIFAQPIWFRATIR